MSKLFAVLITFTQTYGKIRKSKKKTKQGHSKPLEDWETKERREFLKYSTLKQVHISW